MLVLRNVAYTSDQVCWNIPPCVSNGLSRLSHFTMLKSSSEHHSITSEAAKPIQTSTQIWGKCQHRTLFQAFEEIRNSQTESEAMLYPQDDDTFRSVLVAQSGVEID